MTSPRSRRPHRPPAAILAVFAAVATTIVLAAPAAGQDDDTWLRRGLDLERRLLVQDLAAAEQAQVAVTEARTAVDQAVAAIRQSTEAGAAPADLAAGATALAQARGLLAAADQGAAQALASLDERVRRIVLMNRLLGTGPPPAVPDVLTGPWGVTITPTDLEGVFRLQQNGTVVGGTYRLENGRTGSLRGTYVAGRLRLERIDTQSGLDAIFEAEVLPAEGRLVGTWRPTILSSGGPGGGDWIGLRGEAAVEALEEEDVLEDLEDAEAGPDEEIPAGPDGDEEAGP